RGIRQSKLGLTLRQEGHEVWDGVDPLIRSDFPRTVNAFRVVQYESCRGLEGWTTILDGFDEFWSVKRETALDMIKQNEGFVGRSNEMAAEARAWQWAMIPLTRPIDTLVITLRDFSHPASRLVLAVAEAHKDFVWVEQRDERR